jgi:hypothetical protein
MRPLTAFISSTFDLQTFDVFDPATWNLRT